mmetsp:Transcript_14359/g.31234  ORF Transcript_14359/g.31234 Transcript_14359/m.31234 type:complete len:337 (+) Transcript_14359:1-1011(+)
MGGMPKLTKTVRFSTVTIRYHPTILGNNPFVTSGPPLELSWEHEPSATDSDVPVDRHEEVREGRRRNEWDLALSKGERESRLLESGCTREEIAVAVRETCRIKAQRANTVLNLKMSGVEEFAEDVRRKGSKFVGLRKSSNWLYNDWKSNKNTYLRLHCSATVASEDVGPKAKDEAAATLHDGKKKRSPVRHVVQRIIHHGMSTIDSDPTPECPKGGPAFGIDHLSLSTRTGLGFGNDDDTKGVWPFAVINVVHPGSPADEAGLRRGDRLIKLGSITALNHDRCRDIPELGQVAAAKELPIPATVEDENGVRREIAIWPHKWDGRGYFGFLFRELDT